MRAKKTAVSGSTMAPSVQHVSVPWKIIMKAVADISPEDKCILNRSFVEAQIMAGKENWRYVLNASREVLRHACTCPKHSKMSEEQQKSSFASL